MTTSNTTACTPVATEARAATGRAVPPRADVWETDDAAHVVAEVPGATRDGLSITVEDRRLLVAASVAAPEQGAALRTEWRPADYRRAFTLSDEADVAGITATLRHGLLHVTVPKRPETRPHSIEVRVED